MLSLSLHSSYLVSPCWFNFSAIWYLPTGIQRNSLYLELKGSKKNESDPSAHSLDLPKRQNPGGPAVQGHNPGTTNASNLTQASERELAADLMPDMLHQQGTIRDTKTRELRGIFCLHGLPNFHNICMHCTFL